MSYSELTKEELLDQLDLLVAELERRTSQYKKHDMGLLSKLRGCAHKVPYMTLRTANKRAAKFSEQFGVKQRVYECQHCGNWHLTSKPPINKSK